MTVDVKLLGPVEFWSSRQRIRLGSPRQRTVFAVLAAEPGRTITMDRLARRVWGDAPPQDTRGALYSHVSRLRGLLGEIGPRLLRRTGGGYLLDLEPEQVDLHRMRQLLVQARRLTAATPADLERAAQLLSQAYELAAATPLDGLSGAWVEGVRDQLTRERLATAIEMYDAELRLGRSAAAVGPLTGLLAEHPLAEPVAALLMRALHGSGQHAEALEVYRQFRRRLVEELGDEPGTELRQLHQQLLRRELAGSDEPAAGRAAPAPAAGRPTPVQLPPDLAVFAGRAAELAQLDRLLPSVHQPAGTAAGILAIDGTAGVGKTALAVHWAHRVADRFPDGQLFLNLRGFDPGGPPLTPTEAIRALLDAFDVPPAQVPASLSGQVGLWRSLLAGRRMLVLLDNARDAGQVRPLLPGSSGCLALVTSRNRLAGLVATEAAQPLALDRPSPAEARELLARRLGTDRVAAEPAAVTEIVDQCARLPLALAVVAARTSAHPRFSLQGVADQLRAAGLNLLTTEADPAADLRTVLSWSYQALGAPAARLFRLLSLHPGPDVDAGAAASLADLPRPAAGALLAELTRSNLLTEALPGRYSWHDLLRAYAGDLAAAVEDDRDRDAARRRLFDYYLHAAYTAAQRYEPLHKLPFAAPAPGPAPVDFEDRSRALAWFTAEHRVLLAAVAKAEQAGLPRHAWQLAYCLRDFLTHQGYLWDRLATARVGLRAAQRLADRPAQARSHRDLAETSAQLCLDGAGNHLRQALELYTELGDQSGQATIHYVLGWLAERDGEHRVALDHRQQAYQLLRGSSDQLRVAAVLNAIGWNQLLLGELGEGLANCRQALAIQQRQHNVHGAASAWDSLGYGYHLAGAEQRAVGCYQAALALLDQEDSRYLRGTVSSHLAQAYQCAGDLGSARQMWRKALAIYEDLGITAEAERVRAALAAG